MKPVRQNRNSRSEDTHQSPVWLDAARRRQGDAADTRTLIEVRLAHLRLPAESIVNALESTNAAGITDPQVVVVEARRYAETRPRAEVVPIGDLAITTRPTTAAPIRVNNRFCFTSPI